MTQFLMGIVRSYELIVVDDCSTDGTAQLIGGDERVKYVRHADRRGKGAALRSGLEVAVGRYVGYTDADLPVDPSVLITALELLETGQFDLVIGSRRHALTKIIGSNTAGRRVTSWLFAECIRLTLLPGVTDAQCCMKMFRAESLDAVLSRTSIDGYSFDVELLYLSYRAGLRIAECPVTWRDQRDELGPLSSALMFAEMLREAALVWRRHGWCLGSLGSRNG